MTIVAWLDENAARISVEEMVRQVIAAIQADKDLLDRVANGDDRFTAGDLTGPANALVRCIHEDEKARDQYA